MPWAFEGRKKCCLKTLVLSQFNQLHCSWEFKNFQVPTSAGLSRNLRQEKKKLLEEAGYIISASKRCWMSGPSMETRNRWTHSMHAIHLFQSPRISSAPMTDLKYHTQRWPAQSTSFAATADLSWDTLLFLILKFCYFISFPTIIAPASVILPIKWNFPTAFSYIGTNPPNSDRILNFSLICAQLKRKKKKKNYSLSSPSFFLLKYYLRPKRYAISLYKAAAFTLMSDSFLGSLFHIIFNHRCISVMLLTQLNQLQLDECLQQLE